MYSKARFNFRTIYLFPSKFRTVLSSHITINFRLRNIYDNNEDTIVNKTYFATFLYIDIGKRNNKVEFGYEIPLQIR